METSLTMFGPWHVVKSNSILDLQNEKDYSGDLDDTSDKATDARRQSGGQAAAVAAQASALALLEGLFVYTRDLLVLHLSSP